MRYLVAILLLCGCGEDNEKKFLEEGMWTVDAIVTASTCPGVDVGDSTVMGWEMRESGGDWTVTDTQGDTSSCDREDGGLSCYGAWQSVDAGCTYTETDTSFIEPHGSNRFDGVTNAELYSHCTTATCTATFYLEGTKD